MITSADLIALSPLMVLAAGASLILLVIAFYRSHPLTFGLTLLTLALALLALWLTAPGLPHQVTVLLIVDRYASFYLALLFAATFAVTQLAYGYWARRPGAPEEFYMLLLVATLGASVLVTSRHFVSFFLGLELLSVALYVLIAYTRSSPHSVEAGIKYLVLAALAAAFLLFGMALVYATLGTLDLAGMVAMLAKPGAVLNPLVRTGLALIIIGIGFKLAVVPFHMWTPDIYQGAPAPVTAFVATVSKGGMLALLLRYFVLMDMQRYSALVLAFALIAAASMLVGNWLALLQRNVKRILAYSSIAHVGYMLVAFLAGGSVAVAAVTYYLVAYLATTLGAFGVVTVLSGADEEAEALAAYRGLFWRRPWLAAVFTASLLSLAGIPLTAGFVGKFFILSAGVGSALWWLVIVLVVGSVIGLFYYLRIIITMMAPLPEQTGMTVAAALPMAGGIALAGLALAVVWLGVYPSPFLQMIQATVATLL